MKKTILAIALAGLSYGAFAQVKPAKKATTTVVKPAKATTKVDTVKKTTKTVKKVHKKTTKM